MHYTSIKVRGYHLDLYGHVNNARYLEFLEEARWEYLEKHLDLSAFLHGNIALIIVNINIDYRHAAKMDDELQIYTAVKSLSAHRVIMNQIIKLAKSPQTIVAEADITSTIFDKHKQKLVTLDNPLKAQLETMMKQEINSSS